MWGPRRCPKATRHQESPQCSSCPAPGPIQWNFHSVVRPPEWQHWNANSCSYLKADTNSVKLFETRNVHITSHTAFFSSGAEWTTGVTKVYPEPGSQHASLILVHPFWVSNCHELILRAVGFLCIANANSHLLASKDTFDKTWKRFNKPHLAKTSIDESIHEGWC